MSKIVKGADGKTYLIKKDAEGNEEAIEVEDVPATDADDTTADEGAEGAPDFDAAAEKIVASLGIDKLQKTVEALSETVNKHVTTKSESNPLINLEALMKKDVAEMTPREKIVGFFQGMIQNNQPVMKALSEGVDADGGYLFPDEFRAEIIRDIAESPRMRNEVRVIPMRRDVMNMPSLTSRPQVTWTDENATKSTTTAHFGQITLTVKKMAAILYASDELIDDSTETDVVNFIISLFAEAIGEEEDRVIWRGNGTTEPTGIVGSSIGTLTASGNLSLDQVLNLMHELPQKYHRNAKFYMHRENMREMRKLKDSNGRYYWQEPVAQGQPATLYGYPVIEVNELPTSEIYFGDLRQTYWLGDRQRMTVKVSQDTETAFTKDQTAIRVVSRIAGNVVLPYATKGLVSLP